MTVSSSNLIAANMDKVRKKAFNAARSQAISMMENVGVNDDTIAILARDAVANGAATILLKIKGGMVVKDNSEAQALLVSYARTACKSLCRDFVRRPKYDTQKIYDVADEALGNSFELRHVCGQRYTNPLDALLAKEKREEANAATNKLKEKDLLILDTWLDKQSECVSTANIATAAVLGLTTKQVANSVARSKAKLAKSLR